MFQRGGTAMAMERFANLSDEVTEGWSSVRVEMNGLNEEVDGDRRAERIEVCCR